MQFSVLFCRVKCGTRTPVVRDYDRDARLLSSRRALEVSLCNPRRKRQSSKRAPSWAHGPSIWRISPNGASPWSATVSPSVQGAKVGPKAMISEKDVTGRCYEFMVNLNALGIIFPNTL